MGELFEYLKNYLPRIPYFSVWIFIISAINDESLYLHLPAIFHYLDSPQENVKSNDATHEKHETIKQSKEDETGNRNLSDQSSGDKKEASALS